MSSFRKVQFEMEWLGRGAYNILSTYKGNKIKVRTTDAEVYDYYNNDSNKQKHLEAKRYCYNHIVKEYLRIISY